MSVIESPTVRIKCRVGPGMFSYESGILIHGVDRYYESMVDTDLVQIEDGPAANGDNPGTIGVRIIRRDGDRVLIELPREVVAGGRRIWVSASEVV